MVQLVDPQIGERVYDPACGTGGFIVRAFEHVRAQIAALEIDAKEKEELQRELKEEHLYGVEHVPLVFKLALMNMILHGDGRSQLQNGDSLSPSAQDIHRSRYDVILANPPFGPTKQERTAQFEYHIKLYEALFVQHIMDALRPGGRSAVVVKEGLLFDSKKMLRGICRRWVEEFEVLAVIGLPNGVFNPYSGAKTSIVVFRRPYEDEERRTSDVWFYDVLSDGRDLGMTRRPLPDFATDGDLTHLSHVWPYRWNRSDDGKINAVARFADYADSESAQSWWASLEQIRGTEYNLTAGRYSPRPIESVEHERPEVIINRLLDLEDEVTLDLRDLLTLVSVPRTAEGLLGAVRFGISSEE
jgi:type I restriction enzyme M protein